MKLRKLTIQNYRGIKECCWDIRQDFVSLIGSGDSTKTTILDAIGLVLSPRYNLTFTDADFHGANSSTPIVVQAVITDLPDSLVEEGRHGRNRSGIRPDGTLLHDPLDEPDVQECLIIQLRVESSLEPLWEVIRPGDDDGKAVTATQRASLGFARIGDYLDQHLRWGRNSALSSLTSSKTDVEHAVVEAQRQARLAIRTSEGTPLHVAAADAQVQVGLLGNGPFSDLRPGIDPSLGLGSGVLVLHDGDVPLTQFGLGSKRLLSLSIQERAVAHGSLVVIDEVESGLDPHRLHNLVRHLRERVQSGEMQVILTTHSPLVVESLAYDHICVVRSSEGTTTVRDVPPELDSDERNHVQGLMRAQPSALLARRVIVGEGATEVGFLKELLYQWDHGHVGETTTSVTSGVAVTNGSGSDSAPKKAKAFANLGYPTMLVIDGDVIDNADYIRQAEAVGVEVLQWSGARALEDVVFEECSLACMQELVNVACEELSEESVRGSVQARLGVVMNSIDVGDWCQRYGEEGVRKAVAKSAKGQKESGKKEEKKSWFKREHLGMAIADIVLKHASESTSDTLVKAYAQIQTFAYVDPSSNSRLTEGTEKDGQ